MSSPIQALKMTGKRFVFLQALPPNRSNKEHELQQSKARSHAAKVVHRRAKDAERDQLIKVVGKSRWLERTGCLANRHQNLAERSQVDESFTVSIRHKVAEHSADNYEVRPEAACLLLCCQNTDFQGEPIRNTIPTTSFLSLRHGNSDPFDALAIPITSKVNAFMTYTREFYLPALARNSTNVDSVIRSDDWKESVSLLADECTAYAHLSRVAAAMAPLGLEDQNFTLAKEALVFRSKGVSLLRQRVGTGVMDHQTILAISCFFAAEVYDRNFTAARLHARILAQVLQKDDHPVDIQLLFRILSHDYQMAVITLTRPTLDVNDWIPKTFGLYFRPIVGALPQSVRKSISLEAVGKDMNRSIDDENLKDIFVRCRQVAALFRLRASDPTCSGPDISLFIRYLVVICNCRLVNHYLDTEEALRPLEYPSQFALVGHFQVQAYASLALILHWRFLSGMDRLKVAGSSILFDANGVLMHQLKEKIVDSAWMASEISQSQHANIRLWSIYAGAQAEQIEAANTKGDASTAWFNVKLAQQAYSMSLLSWQQVRECLLGFLHSDVQKPQGSVWFPRTMKANSSL